MTFINLEKTFLTDEKIFKLLATNNKQNDRIYGVNLSDIREKGHSEKSSFPVSVKVSAGVSKLRKTSIHFVTLGAKILVPITAMKSYTTTARDGAAIKW